MPKIIKNPEDRILQAAGKRLLDKDLSSFSLRGIAADCGIAVGTIYNYFKDKESLMAAVMVQDWMDALEDTRKELAQAQSLQEGLLHICRGIRNFCLRYQKVWSSYSAGGDFSTRYRMRHELLLSQITEMIKGLYQHPEIREEEIIEIII